jgi:hypothetical protein
MSDVQVTKHPMSIQSESLVCSETGMKLTISEYSKY